MDIGNIKIYESNQIDNNFKIHGLIKNVSIQNIDETFERFRISLNISLVLLVNDKDVEIFYIDSIIGELSINGSRICEMNRRKVIKFNKYGYSMWQSCTIYNDINKLDMTYIKKLMDNKKECRLKYLGEIQYEKDKNVQIEFEYLLPRRELEIEIDEYINKNRGIEMQEKEKNYKKDSTGIHIGGDMHINNSQISVGDNVEQNQSIEQIGFEKLRKDLIDFQKGANKIGLSTEDLNIVNGDISAAIKESNKDIPAKSKIIERFKSAINVIKESGKFVENVPEVYESAKNISKFLGILSLLGLR